jgi:GntR family transcriptional regulator/MocR family aminotransferase
VTPLSRRQALLSWAKERADRWIIEDDYDSEFRFAAHPMPTMQSLDSDGRVIYMNTFSKTLAPSIRISYMVLPPELMERFRENLGFYSCTVSSFEQYTLSRFLSRGYFEKHINRMRKYYKMRRNEVVSALNRCAFADKLTIREEDAGLHFLLQVDTPMTDDELTAYCESRGIRVRTLSSYYHLPIPETDKRCLVINYAGLRQADLEKVLCTWDG